jgi:hypothetical protein
MGGAKGQVGTSAVPVSQLFSESAHPKPASCFLRTSHFCAIYGTTLATARRWAKQGKVQFIRVPPRPRGRIYILDPQWTLMDRPSSPDPTDWFCLLRQCDVARLLGISARMLRYMETAGKAHYRLVGHRKLYSLGEVRKLLARRLTGRDKPTKRERDRIMLEWASGS